jgi:hypothetical protein
VRNVVPVRTVVAGPRGSGRQGEPMAHIDSLRSVPEAIRRGLSSAALAGAVGVAVVRTR